MPTVASLNVDLLADVNDLARGMRSGTAEIQQLKAEVSDQAAFREWTRAQRDARQVIESVKTPAERYAQEISRLRRMLQLGAIDQETFTRATRQAGQAMRQAATGGAGMSAQLSKLNRTAGLLAGGGAIAAVLQLVRMVEQGAREVRSLTAEFRDGEIGTRSYIDSLASAVPVGGDVYRMFREVGGALSEITAGVSGWFGLEGVSEFFEDATRAAEKQTALLKQAAKLGDAWRDVRERATLAGLSGTAADEFRAQADYAREVQRINALGFRGMGDTQRGLISDMRAAAKELRDSRLAEIAEQARAPITGLIQQLHKQARAMRMTAEEAQFLKAMHAGATWAELEHIEALQSQIASYRDAQQAAAEYRAEQERMAQAVESLVGGLERQIDTFGLSAKELSLLQLQENSAARDVIDYTAALHDQLDALKERNALEEEAARIYEATRTPLERYMTELQKLGRMLEEGLIDQDTAQRRFAELQAGMESRGGGTGRVGLAGAAERGTAEAYSVIVRALHGGVGSDEVKLLRDQLAEAIRGNRILEELLRRAEGGGVVESFN